MADTETRRKADTETRRREPVGDAERERALLRVAHMFEQHRDSAVMRELCRLAVKCAQEGLIRD